MSYYKNTKNTFNNSFIRSVNAALEGVVHTLISERNMRIHFAIGFLMLIAGIYFNLTPVEFMILCFTVTFVLVAEMFNTAVEYMVDLLVKEKNMVAGIVKDIAAGAVFVSSVNAAVVGYILFTRHLGAGISGAFNAVRHSSWHVTFIVFLVVLGMVIFIKILRKEKSLLRGGMPSGHSAVAFSAWIAISMVTENSLVSLLVFFMAFIIAKSRIACGVHSSREVIIGALLGTLLSLMIFQLFYGMIG